MVLSTALPLVSIRIPAYNHEKFITDCLNSVANETYPNKELVIIDDGSSDNTAVVIQSWIQRSRPGFPVLFLPRQHRGLSPTLNELVSRCNGKYLVSLASDDILIPGGIQQRVDYLETHKSKSAVIGDCIVINELGKKLSESGLTSLYKSQKLNYGEDSSLKHEILWNWAVPGPVLMVRKSIYGEIGTYNTNLAIEDWDFYLRVVSKNLLGFVDSQVSGYRLHKDNTFSSTTKTRGPLDLAIAARINLRRFRGKDRLLLFLKMNILLISYLKFVATKYWRKQS